MPGIEPRRLTLTDFTRNSLQGCNHVTRDTVQWTALKLGCHKRPSIYYLLYRALLHVVSITMVT